MDKKMIIENITEYLKNRPDILFAYIFGSFIEKEKYNDLDIAVFLADGKIESMEYLTLKRELTDIAGIEADVAILNGASPLLRIEVIRNGLLVWERDRDCRISFLKKAVFEYEDMKIYYEMSYRSLIEKIEKNLRQT